RGFRIQARGDGDPSPGSDAQLQAFRNRPFTGPSVIPSTRFTRAPGMELLTDRTTIIALAIAGACLVTAGSVFRSRSRNTARLAHLVVWVGYLVSLASVSLFVAAGFLSDR